MEVRLRNVVRGKLGNTHRSPANPSVKLFGGLYQQHQQHRRHERPTHDFISHRCVPAAPMVAFPTISFSIRSTRFSRRSFTSSAHSARVGRDRRRRARPERPNSKNALSEIQDPKRSLRSAWPAREPAQQPSRVGVGVLPILDGRRLPLSATSPCRELSQNDAS
jgi:hypothetical protein